MSKRVHFDEDHVYVVTKAGNLVTKAKGYKPDTKKGERLATSADWRHCRDVEAARAADEAALAEAAAVKAAEEQADREKRDAPQPGPLA